MKTLKMVHIKKKSIPKLRDTCLTPNRHLGPWVPLELLGLKACLSCLQANRVNKCLQANTVKKMTCVLEENL